EERAETPGMPPTVIWEYWDGSGWSPLRASDGSQDLRVRGYLGFFSPYDHQAGTEFGRKAFWLRARPHLQPPLADAGSDQAVFVEDGEATLTLDASASRVFNRQHISRYVWRLVSSRPPVADAGSDQTVSTPTVTLDASGSQAADERPIVKYIWRRIEPHEESEERRDEKPMATPFLKAIRPNTVSALNAVTISDEVLGSSDGNPDQIFSLTHAPVHADGAQIAVREPDDPPKDELRQLEKELRQTDKEAQALLSPPEAIAAWVRWHQVSDFYDSEPH
ncbi:MAG: hypothetical protein GTO63_25635, partial [Anaerolineae bacterium]|nr:hypothetical protein [Anaerolineae bacterium]NIN98102.1 hypothetical protein [Anaerolineae bacterium]NIQ81048.1 hypothetical protein [Anaerolineae bacterium]